MSLSHFFVFSGRGRPFMAPATAFRADSLWDLIFPCSCAATGLILIMYWFLPPGRSVGCWPRLSHSAVQMGSADNASGVVRGRTSSPGWTPGRSSGAAFSGRQCAAGKGSSWRQSFQHGGRPWLRVKIILAIGQLVLHARSACSAWHSVL